MLPTNASEVYSSEYFAAHAPGSANSASRVVPLVTSILPIKSVVDVGCGTGCWAAEFLANGVPDVWGIDGDYADRSQLRIPADRFLVWDLLKPLQVGRNFDLAVCLEVAEHLPESRASGLVSDLVTLSSCILFSAAVPGQGGAKHINEQYLSYWVDLFRMRGYQGIDPIRPQILGNDSVEWWYQQNMVMFVSPEHELAAKGFPKPQNIIHQYLYERAKNRTPTLRTLLSAFPAAVLRSLRYHLGFH